MSHMVPEAAVEAIARALVVEVYGVDIFDGMSGNAQGILRKRGTLLLEAAAPHMLADEAKLAAIIVALDPLERATDGTAKSDEAGCLPFEVVRNIRAILDAQSSPEAVIPRP